MLQKSRAPGSAYTTQKPTNNGYLLDTDTVSELTKPRPNNGLLQFLATVPEYRLFLSFLTIGEKLDVRVEDPWT